MSFALECKKVKRTGFVWAFICCGILSALVPILNMMLRSDMYLSQNAPPLEILFNANWQMMSMLNILLVVAGSSIIYHTEYADNAIQKMKTLPILEGKIFFNKFVLMAVMTFITFVIEMIGIGFSAYHWFEFTSNTFLELVKNFGYSFLLILPAILTSILISSAFKNIWLSLGIGVVCVFVATVIPTSNFYLSLFPYALPFQIFSSAKISMITKFIIASLSEILILSFSEIVFVKVRRHFE